jgi:hypothetical protein
MALAAVGLALAGAGLWLTGSPRPVEVSMDSGAYTVGGARLDAAGPGVYERSGEALVVRWEGTETRAAASATFEGRHLTGVCTVTAGSSEERCRFTVGGRELQSVDRRTATGWHRRYGDGLEVDIQVRGSGPVPVPFPIGA